MKEIMVGKKMPVIFTSIRLKKRIDVISSLMILIMKSYQKISRKWLTYAAERHVSFTIKGRFIVDHLMEYF